MTITNEYDMSDEACIARETQRRLWNIEDWLLRTAGSKEEAQRITQYLVTVDWDQTAIRQKKDETRYAEAEKQRIEEIIESGGGYCEECEKLSNTLIEFTHTINRYGKLIQLSPSEQSKKRCYRCLHDMEKWYYVDPDDYHEFCDDCKTLTTRKFLEEHPMVKNRWVGYCPACRNKYTQQYTITCAVCGNQSLQQDYRTDTCTNCAQKYPYQNKVSQHNYRAQSVGLPGTLSLAQWINALIYFNFKCAYCGQTDFRDLEHYLPIELQGGTTVTNCVPSCRHCNNRKQDKHPTDFERLFPTDNITRIKAYFASLQPKEQTA
jgi:5-methylcytosine-specific restriction endonuclease McrA